ncbi:YitT family protein [Grimontia sp. S25]|uniref:YitT family protein n=2 Tax=Grimontia sedimenti TaxID=2711294 RepID=A0A6M1RHJ8_9GAMM|nr:YitT family protein [Grimontia sedimenti]NGN99624.1 YitT family protein [Grimontia sedimenti]
MSYQPKHSQFEDMIAVLSGAFIVAQGVYFLQQAGLLTGGTTGLALLITQFTDLSFGTIYFLMNVPFYFMGWQRFGTQFALRSVFAGGMVSLIVDHISHVFTIGWLQPLYCGLIGGLLMGVGMLMIFRHNASLGGFNVLALYCQDKFGVRAGNVQMAIDIAILLASFFFVSPWLLACSVVGAFVLNLVLTMNHRPDRYVVCY